MAKEKTARELVDNFTYEHEKEIEIAKGVAEYACTAGVQYTVYATLQRTCPANTRGQKFCRIIGGWVIAKAITAKAGEIIDKAADDISDGIVLAIEGGRKVKKYIDERM